MKDKSSVPALVIAPVAESTQTLDADLKSFRQQYGDWSLSQHLMNWLAKLHADSKIKKGDYVGNDYRITLDIL